MQLHEVPKPTHDDPNTLSPSNRTLHSAPPSPQKKRKLSQMDEEDELANDTSESEMELDPDDTSGFRFGNVLPEPTAKGITTQELHDMIHQGQIDLNPPWQRGVVWPEAKQIRLIDSLLRNYYIPPVVFCTEIDDDGERVKVCIDGKQRLTSIQKFFDGQIPHRDLELKKNWWWTSPEKLKNARSVIPDRFKRIIQAKKIQCVIYPELPPGIERDIFQRVQLGVALTAAEKLKAVDSPWAQWISDLKSRHIECDQGLTQAMQWDTIRDRDFQGLAQMVYVCDGLPNENVPTAQKLEKFLSREDSPNETFKADVDHALLELYDIAVDTSLNDGFTRIKKRVAPIEFVYIGALLYKMRKSTLEDKAKRIFEMRRALRNKHPDLRMKAEIGRDYWVFINEASDNPTGKMQEKPVKKPHRKNAQDSDSDFRP